MRDLSGRLRRRVRSKLVLAAGLAVFAIGSGLHIHSELRGAHREFARQATQAESLIRGQLREFSFMLNATRGLMREQRYINTTALQRFLAPLDPYHRFPFIRALGFTANAADPLVGPQHTFVTAAYWLDEDSRIRAAATRARDSATVTTIHLHEPADAQSRGLLLQLLPVYRGDTIPVGIGERRSELVGWVTALIDVNTLFGQFGPELDSLGLNLVVRHNDFGTDEVVFRYGEEDIANDDLHYTAEVPVGGQLWRTEFSAPSALHADAVSDTAMAAVAMTILLLTWLFFERLVDSRERALATAGRLAYRQRRNQARYRKLFESTNAIALLVDPVTRTIVDANTAAADFYGVRRSALRGMALDAVEVGHHSGADGLSHLVRHRTARDDVRDLELHSGPVETGDRRLDFYLLHDVTEQRSVEEALRASEQKYRTIVETTTQGFWLCNAETGRVTEANGAMAKMLGLEPGAVAGHLPIEFVDDAAQPQLLSHIQDVFIAGHGNAELVLRRRDGSHFFAFCNATMFGGDKEQPASVFSFFVDISEQKKVMDDLRVATTFFNHSAEGIVVTDHANRIVEVNPAFTDITGYTREEVLGQDPRMLSSGRHGEDFYLTMWEQLRQQGHWQGEVWNRRRNGEVFPEWLSIFIIHDDAGAVIQHVAVFSDMSRHKRDEEIIWRQANFDALTGLPNRDLFIDRVALMLRDAERERHSIAVMFIDLDRFKWVNETLGHTAGDDLVQQVAERLTGVVEDGGSVARFGGDEFTILVESVEHFQGLDTLAEEILRSFRRPFLLVGREIFLTASLGIALYPHDGDEVQALLRNAEAAMYGAKDSGRNTFRYFTQDLNDMAQRRVTLEQDLRKAIDNEDIEVFYQPIVDAERRLLGAEALVRWNHPEFGRISPDEYIPLAEEIGLIIPIEQQVMRAACTEAATWRERFGQPLFVSVNVTSAHCRDPYCVDFIDALLTKECMDASMLKLELTERMMMDDTEQMRGFVERLQERGVRLAVDDFGTGYSALGYLKRFPVDTLKIDRSFIKDLPADTDDRTLVEAIILMAHSLGVTVVAEGVETEAQFDLLRSLGCDQFQGYLFARALEPEAFHAFAG